MSSQKYDTLVLAGASVKGFLTGGALQYLYDKNLLDLKNYIGTSIGAILCFLLVIGYTPIEIMVYICTNQMVEKIQHFDLVAMVQGKGATSFQGFYQELEKMTIEKIGYLPTFNDIKEKFGKNLVCVTHNLTEKRTEYLGVDTHPTLPCLTALRMSANLPLVFELYKYGHSYYIDGAVSDNYAIQLGDELGEKVIGILISNEDDKFDKNAGIMSLIFNIMFIPIQKSIEYKINQSSENCLTLRLSCDKELKFFNFNVSSKDKMELFASGYEQTKKLLS
jgi:predicted acylesterase/phospholipase RssA